MSGPPPPPPPPSFRGPGMGPRFQQHPGGQPLQGGRGRGGPGPRPQMPMHMQPRIIQQSSQIRDIRPQKLLTEAECRQKLTTYAAYSIRKVPAQSRKEKPSWARADVTEDHLDQADIKKQIKKLNENRKTIAEKRAALAPFQHGQVTALLDELASKEKDKHFEWSLVQMDRKEKDVSASNKSGKRQTETVVMMLYVKRAPCPDLNAVMLYQNIEQRRMDSLRPQPPPQPPMQQHPPPEGRPPSAHQVRGGEASAFVEISKDRARSPGPIRTKGRKYNDREGSSTGSSDSYDTESGSESDASGSSIGGTSISAESRERKKNGRQATRSHSRHRPKPLKYLLGDRIVSPERGSDAYGVPQHAQQRPYAPEPPRTIPAMDPITSAYQAGQEDARAEQFGSRFAVPVSPQPVIIERIIERPPIERVIEQPRIERIIEAPRGLVSYSRLPERPRFAETRYIEERFVDDVRSQEDDFLIRRKEMEDNAIFRHERQRREAEDYMDRSPLERPEFLNRRSYSLRGDSSPSPTREYFDRRTGEPRQYRRPEPLRRAFTTQVPHPFAQALPRRYPGSTSSGGNTDGW